MERAFVPITTAMIGQPRGTITRYPQFDGRDGRDYLNTILVHILPMALHRTWYIAVNSLRGLDTPCVMTTAEIAEHATVSQVKIERDLHELEARGLLRRYVERRAIVREDGNTYYPACLIKDFTVLYDLAYEYHQWCSSVEYVPPEHAFADFIKADRQLYMKLIRFDCYRRMLCYKKPERKPQIKRRPSTDEYNTQEIILSFAPSICEKSLHNPSES
jgi:hypothetical protein